MVQEAGDGGFTIDYTRQVFRDGKRIRSAREETAVAGPDEERLLDRLALRGALLGGFILGVAENYGSALFGTQWKDVVAFVLLVVILLFRPTGLLGESLGRSRA